VRLEGIGGPRADPPVQLQHLRAALRARARPAHARSGDRVAIASYLGRSDAFDRAIAIFSDAYADQNERDYDAFLAAIKSGRLTAARTL
jgi:hypothetical protein